MNLLDLKVSGTTSHTEPVPGTFTEVGEVTRTWILWAGTRQGRGLGLTFLGELEVEQEKYKDNSGDRTAEHSSCAEQFQLLELCRLSPVTCY